MQPDSVVTTVKGEKIRVSDVIAHLKLKGQFREAIYEIIEQKVVLLSAEEFHVNVAAEELERRARERRLALGIDDAERFEMYLRFHGTTEDRWLRHIRLEALREALKHTVVSPERVKEAFSKEPARFATVSIARIVCRTRREAEDALAEARSVDFVDLARKYSIDDHTKMSGGFMGHVKAGMLPPEVGKVAFRSEPNDVIGPFRENNLWTIYKVHAVNVPKLTESLCKSIRDQIFGEWLRQRVCSVPA